MEQTGGKLAQPHAVAAQGALSFYLGCALIWGGVELELIQLPHSRTLSLWPPRIPSFILGKSQGLLRI